MESGENNLANCRQDFQVRASHLIRTTSQRTPSQSNRARELWPRPRNKEPDSRAQEREEYSLSLSLSPPPQPASAFACEKASLRKTDSLVPRSREFSLFRLLINWLLLVWRLRIFVAPSLAKDTLVNWSLTNFRWRRTIYKYGVITILSLKNRTTNSINCFYESVVARHLEIKE